jgi:hypothetical protein
MVRKLWEHSTVKAFRAWTEKKWKTANDDDASFPANDNNEELSLGPVDKRLPTTTDKLIVCADRLESELCGEGIDLRGQL